VIGPLTLLAGVRTNKWSNKRGCTKGPIMLIIDRLSPEQFEAGLLFYSLKYWDHRT